MPLIPTRGGAPWSAPTRRNRNTDATTSFPRAARRGIMDGPRTSDFGLRPDPDSDPDPDPDPDPDSDPDPDPDPDPAPGAGRSPKSEVRSPKSSPRRLVADLVERLGDDRGAGVA